MRSYKLALLAATFFICGFTYITEKHIYKLGKDISTIEFHQLNRETQKQVRCLAENMYYEAVGESRTGRIAIAFVTLNRVEHLAYPNTICEVVTQKYKNVCQFSWVCQKEKYKNFIRGVNLKEDNPSYEEILRLATYVYLNRDSLDDPTKGSLYYHADYVSPNWNLKKTVQIGKHIFYNKS